MAASSSAQKEAFMYSTQSMCPKCVFLERKGFEWKPSVVAQRGNEIWLSCRCPTHGNHDTLVCSDSSFFHKMMRFSPRAFEPDTPSSSSSAPKVSDIEDLMRRLEFKSDAINHPLVMEMAVYEKGNFLADDEIVKRVRTLLSMYPPNVHCILRVNGKLAPDITLLNSKVRVAADAAGPHRPVLLELSYDRTQILSTLPDTVLFSSHVYPSVKIYVGGLGEEDQAQSDMEALLSSLQSISNVQCVVSLHISRPYPDLTRLLALLRAHPTLVRSIIINLERTPKQISDSFSTPASASSASSASLSSASAASIDPVEILQILNMATGGEISMDDFFPMSAGVILEPFVSLLGLGNFNIRPSPMCGFATLLANTEKLTSVPLTRLFDVDKLYTEMSPVVKKLKNSGEKIGFFTARNIKSALEKSIGTTPQAASAIPSCGLIPYLTEQSKADIAKRTIRSTQMLIVHAMMDIGSVDSQRRSRCTMCEYSASSPGNVVAGCTHCV